ncbi:nrfC protein [Vibrio sp. JCM 19236]|nr:nrfC protein [Vibrio sp. JCM 19236]
MSCSRRNFLAGAGAVIFTTGTGVASVASSKKSFATTEAENSVKLGMLHDENACIGCTACTEACREVNKVPEASLASRLNVLSLWVNSQMWSIDSLAHLASTAKIHLVCMCAQLARLTKTKPPVSSTCIMINV